VPHTHQVARGEVPVNGPGHPERAGVGFDADMIRDADRGLKTRLGRFAYLWTGLRNIGAEPTQVKIRIDGTRWFGGAATCVLIGNVGTILGGVRSACRGLGAAAR
jgi:diacylglycerol kinase (ATP)